MAQGTKTAAEAERLLRRAARRIGNGWTVEEVPGQGGRRRGKGSHKMIGLYDQDGAMLAWATIPQHPGDLSPRVSREIEATFEPHLGEGMDEQVTPTYQVRIWQEDGWWLARVMATSEGADTSPLNALTQARSLARIESMGRDLIATILDADEGSFDVEFEYLLPGDSGNLVCQAKGARAWLEAAQDLWQERSASAARALAGEGYSLRETATLLGLSHQRVDQILGNHSDRKPSNTVVICEGPSEAAWLRQAPPASAPVILVVWGGSIGSSVISRNDASHTDVANRFRALLHEFCTITEEDYHKAESAPSK